MAPACLFVFDLLELDGEDVRARPLLERKALLKEALAGWVAVSSVSYSRSA
jgi:ATP-dependent DNA ligase